MNNPLFTRQQMNLRRLAKQVLDRIDRGAAKRVLVTSISKSDGKARLINELHGEMEKLDREPFTLLKADQLETVSPDEPAQNLVVVYGPAYYDADGLHQLPERWLSAFDTVIIVVMARRTNAKQLREMLDWLKTYGIENIWAVWNEMIASPFDFLLPRFLRRIGVKKYKLEPQRDLDADSLPLDEVGKPEKRRAVLGSKRDSKEPAFVTESAGKNEPKAAADRGGEPGSKTADESRVESAEQSSQEESA